MFSFPLLNISGRWKIYAWRREYRGEGWEGEGLLTASGNTTALFHMHLRVIRTLKNKVIHLI